PEVFSGEEYTKAADVYSFAFVAYEIITGIPPYHDVSHDKDLAFNICNGFRPKIPFNMPKLITQIIMRCWDARITHRPTFDELSVELDKYWMNYKKNGFDNNNEISIQIKEAEEFSKNQITDATAATSVNYITHPLAIYTSRLLNFSNLPKPKNEEKFEKKLAELTESFYQINSSKHQLYLLL
ncbi:11365_t:CDS:1, partial [Dentiscutata erythropus]